MMLTLGSSSAIVAHNLAALGSRVGFQSRIGDDSLGQIALQRLNESGVDVSRVLTVPGPVKTALTIILQHQDWRNILTYSGTIVDLTLDELDLEFLTDSRHFHLSSFYLQKGLTPQVPELFRKLKQAGLTISLDTNDDPNDCWEEQLFESLRYVDVFLPNMREAKKIVRTDNLEVAVTRLAEIVPTVVIKMGAGGAMAQRGNECLQSPAQKVDFVDPVGAGDSFDAGFLHQFVQGADLGPALPPATGSRHFPPRARAARKHFATASIGNSSWGRACPMNWHHRKVTKEYSRRVSPNEKPQSTAASPPARDAA